MDRNIDIRTPESIVFSYELAGVGSRFLAVAADLAIQMIIVIGLFVGLGLLASHVHLGHVKSTPAIDQLGTSILVGVLVFVNFLIFFGYFILFEAFWHGQTPGKRLLGIRVVRDGGFPLEFWGSLIRNILRIGELMLGFYVVSAITSIFSPENKRIGDYAAGTIVIRDSSYEFPRAFRFQTP